jgi:hypothetical protein
MGALLGLLNIQKWRNKHVPGLHCVLSTSICCLPGCLHCAPVLTSRLFAAVQASIAANTYVVSGASQTKSEAPFFK